jgi:hypothetical protein
VEDVNNGLQFVIVSRLGDAPPRRYPNVVLVIDNWDDYHFKTMFDVTLRISPNENLSLGWIKILQRGQVDGRPGLQSSFEELDADFCSFGQEIQYYE